MEHTKKMILVDPRTLDSFRESSGPPVPDATSQSLREMDEQMRAILDSGNMHVEDKANMYHQTLRRYLTRFDQYKDKPMGTVKVQETSVPDTKETLSEHWEKDIIESVPKSMRNKAGRLLRYLQSHPKLKWNERGEMVWNDQVIKSSNIMDLVHDVIRKRRQPEPVGWREFAEVLTDVNVPRELVGNVERWNFMQKPSLNKTPQPESGDLPFMRQKEASRVKTSFEHKDTPLKWRNKSFQVERKSGRSAKKLFPVKEWETL